MYWSIHGPCANDRLLHGRNLKLSCLETLLPSNNIIEKYKSLTSANFSTSILDGNPDKPIDGPVKFLSVLLQTAGRKDRLTVFDESYLLFSATAGRYIIIRLLFL